MNNTSKSNPLQKGILAVVVAIVVIGLAVAGWLLNRSPKMEKTTDASGNSVRQNTSPAIVPSGVATSPSSVLPTAPASLDAGEKDVDTKLNALDTGSKDIDAAINETPVDLSQ